MNNKEYLNQAYRLNEEIESDLKELEDLESKRLSLQSPKIESVVKGGSKSSGAQFTKIVDKIVDLRKRLNDNIDRYIDLKEEIRKVIEKVTDTDERLLLKCRYLNYMTWSAIAEEMHYSERHIHRIHEMALGRIKRK